MRTPYVSHIFGEEVTQKLMSGRGWLNAGVASSIPWPASDVCIEYAGVEYFLRGSEKEGNPSPPGITVTCGAGKEDEAIANIYRLTSILSWHFNGYVDVSGYIYGGGPALYGNPRNVYSEVGTFGEKSFQARHLPIIDDENTRKSLAFWREGKRLARVHDGYSFLSFYKVIEAQFKSKGEKIKWIQDNIPNLDGRAAERVQELLKNNIDVGRHLFESGRCAVAHASFEGEIVDPDIPEDRRRLSDDLVIMEELARTCIADFLNVPNSSSLYSNRDRLEPWRDLINQRSLEELMKGGEPEDVDDLDELIVSVGIWPDGPLKGLEKMKLRVLGVNRGVLKIALINESETIVLVFYLDYPDGKIHTNLDEGGIIADQAKQTEEDATTYYTYFHSVLGNEIVEITHENYEPVDCEIVIPVNIIPIAVEEGVRRALENFRNQRQT